MTFSHNTEADFVASELARMFVSEPSLCYAERDTPITLSATASYEAPSSPWPRPDGLVSLLESGTQQQRDIALEYKRPQEGIHGLLTAIGQAQAYLYKGYSGAAIVVPTKYPSFAEPAGYISAVLDLSGASRNVGVFGYVEPDLTSATPFADRLSCVKKLQVDANAQQSRGHVIASHPRTQWVHMREGSTTRDAFFRFLQTSKKLSAEGFENHPLIPQGLRDAISRIAPHRTAEDYLSNTVDDTRFLNRVWRAFWFEWIATGDVLTVWRRNGQTYEVPNACTRIRRDDDRGNSQIFEGRASSLKNQIVRQLNTGGIGEDEAWEQFAAGISQARGQQTQGVRDRAHSYREDLDSSLAQLEWIDNEGFPTDHGYRYMTICERFGGANSNAAKEYVGATLLKAGHYASFLHYIHRLSEGIFSNDPLAFTQRRGTTPVFNEASYTRYLARLETELSENLKVMRKVSGRSRPRRRTVFQAELTLLRNYGFVSKARFRLGVGIPIDWEKVHQAMNIEL